jgi:TP901 family phage tail tape measure protein
MATQRRVEFQGSFNIQEILSAVDVLQNRLGKIQLDDSSVRRFEKTFSDLRKRAQEIDAEIKQGFTNPSQINTFNGHLQKLGQQMEILRGEIGRIDTSFDNLQLSPNLQKQFENLKNSANTMFDAYESQIANIESKISSFAEKSNISFGSEEISGLAQAISSEEELARLRQDKQASLQQEKGLRESNLASLKEELDISAKISKEQDAKYTELSKQIIEQQQRVSQVKNTDTEAEESSKLANLRAQRKAIKSELDKQISAQTSLVEKIKKEEKELNDVESSLSNIQKFFQALSGDSSGLDNDAAAAAKEFASLNTKVAQLEKELNQANAELQKFKDLQTQKTKTGLEKSIDDVDRLKTGLDKASDSTKDMSDSLASLNKQDEFFNNLKNRATAVFGLTNAFIYMNRFIRKSVDAIKELDAAFTEIAVVTNMTTSQLWESFDTYNEMAQKLGTTTVDAIQTSALYYQQGLDTVEVMQLTEETMKMARIAGMDYAEATDRMTAALRGFKLEMSEASRVNDVFSALAAESAVDTDELSYALTKTASIAQSAGMELETTSAFLSQMIETTREAPENIGTAMKTIIARFQELKSAVGDSVEIDGELVDVNKVDTALKTVGVQLRDSLTGQFRDLDDVFLELASKWDTLDRNTQRYVATIAAGSRQQSRFIAMMDNYERTLELVDIAQNSNGASAAQFAKTLDSLEAKMNNIQSSFEEFIGTVVGSEFVKDLLDGANTVLQMINNIAEKGPVAIGVFGTFFIVMIKKIISNTIASAKIVTSAFSSGWQKVTGNYTASMKKANQDSVKSLEDAIRNSNIAQVLATQIERGIRTGATAGLNGTSAQVTGTTKSGSHAKAPILAQPGQKFNQKYRNQIVARLESGQSISQEDRKFLKENNINLGKNNQELLQNVKNYKSVNSALSKFSPALSQVGSTLASFGTMYIMGDAATKGTAALTGATTGSMVGSLVGTLGYAIPGAGMVLGPLFSALGGTLGAFIGEGIGESLDNQKYGIGSEANIKRFKEEAARVAEETSKSIEENTNLVSLGEEYIQLSEKINLTNEEKERLAELNELLISQWDGLEYVNSGENGLRQISISSLKEEIRLKKELIAADTARLNYANFNEKKAEITRANTDAANKAQEEMAKYRPSVNRTSSVQGSYYGQTQTIVEDFPEQFSQNIEEYKAVLGDALKQANYTYSGRQHTMYFLEARNLTEQQLKDNKDMIMDFAKMSLSEGDLAAFNKSIEDYTKTLDENKEKLIEELKGLNSDISSILDAAFTGISTDSFSAQNKGYLNELLKVENILSEQEINDFIQTGSDNYEELLKERNKLARNFINNLDSFNEKEREAFTTSLSLIGLLGDNKEESKAKIQQFLDDELGGVSDAVKEVFDQIFDVQYDDLSENWEELLDVNKDYVNKLADSFAKGQGGEELAARFASMTIKAGDMAPAFIAAFQNQFENLLNKYAPKGDNGREVIQETAEEFEAIMEALSSTNVTSANSIAQLGVKLKDLGLSEEEVLQLTNSLGSVFSRSGLTAEEALSDIESKLEGINSLISIIENNIDGTLSLSQLDQLNSQLEKMGKNLLENSQIVATGDGFKIKGDVGGIISSGTQGTRDYMINMAKEASLGQMMKEEQAAMAEANGDYERRNTLLEQANEYSKTSQYYLAAEADIRARTIKAQMVEANEEKKRLYDLIQQYKDMIAEMERYYNIQRKILQLQNEQKNFSLDFELAINSDQAGEAAKNQILNLVEQQALLKQAGQIYQKDLQELGNYINKDFGQFLTVDDSGNIFQNTDELVKLAQKMKGATEQESKELQKQWDEIAEVQSAYEDLYDTVNANAQEYKQNLIEQRKLEQQIRQYQINLEKTLRDMVIKEMQAEVKAVQDKYNKIKQEDQKYLASLQKNINKRKQLQSDQNQDKEIATLQSRIGLLQRDTSGIYTKELEDLQAELDQLLQEKSNTTLERLYEEEEAKTQKVSDELTLRSEYLQQQLDYELETYAISNEKVAELLKMKDEEILAWMTQHSEDFRKATTTEQENFINTWRTQINEGKAAQQALTDDVEIQKVAILQKFQEIKTGGIDVYIKAMQEAQKQKIVMDVNTDQLDVALTKLKTLDKEKNDFMKSEAQREMDRLLVDIEKAYSAGNKAEGERLKKDYQSTLGLYKKYQGDVTDVTMTKYGKSYEGAEGTAQGVGQGTFDASHSDTSANQDPLQGTKWLANSTSTLMNFYKNTSGDLIGSYTTDWKFDNHLGRLKVVGDYGDYVEVQADGWSQKSIDGKTLTIDIPGMTNWTGAYVKRSDLQRLYTKYATGGMVDYTGPAWVDGTKTKPEAFLSAADTANIAKLRDILSKVFDSPKSSSNDSPQNQNSGDTYYEFHITVDELGEGYDAKDMMADMEKYIIQKSNYRNVINIGKRK